MAFHLFCLLVLTVTRPPQLIAADYIAESDFDLFEDFIGEYRVLAGAYGTPPCPLLRAGISRGQRYGTEGVFLEASGHGEWPDGTSCEATLEMVLSSEAPGNRCREHKEQIICMNAETKGEVTVGFVGEKLLVQIRPRRGGDRGLVSLLLRRRAGSP